MAFAGFNGFVSPRSILGGSDPVSFQALAQEDKDLRLSKPSHAIMAKSNAVNEMKFISDAPLALSALRPKDNRRLIHPFGTGQVAYVSPAREEISMLTRIKNGMY